MFWDKSGSDPWSKGSQAAQQHAAGRGDSSTGSGGTLGSTDMLGLGEGKGTSAAPERGGKHKEPLGHTDWSRWSLEN